ncbi:hypothetical protein ACFFRR_010386 [Megaselia abdita]
MSIRTRFVFPVLTGRHRSFTECIAVPSLNFTHQATFFCKSSKEGSFTVSIDENSAKKLQIHKLQVKYEVFQKQIYQNTHLHKQGKFSFSDKSAIHMYSKEYFVLVTILDCDFNELSEITGVSDESNFGLRTVGYQRIKGHLKQNFKHNFSCLTEKLGMICSTSLDSLNNPELHYKLVAKDKKDIQTGIVSFQYAKMVDSFIKTKDFSLVFNSFDSIQSSDECLVIISLGTTYEAELNHTFVEVVKKAVPTRKWSVKLENLISKAMRIFN